MTATIDEPITVDGTYDIPAERYHRGDALSASGAKRLLPPSCPALFRHHQQHGQHTTKAFDLGNAAHKVLLGSGPELVKIDRPRWDTNAVKAEVADVRAAGGVPLKADEYDQIHAMVAALRAHPYAGALFDPAHGKAEQSLYWTDPATGVRCRARLDFLPDRVDGRRMLVPDYKSTNSAAPDKLSRVIHDYGYFIQAAWYLEAVEQLGLADAPVFLLVFQEKTAPYLVTVVELNPATVHIGRRMGHWARQTYATCVETGVWPGYTDDVLLLGLPPWVERDYEGVLNP